MREDYASSDDQDVFFARAMTYVASILHKASDRVYTLRKDVSLENKSQQALRLDHDLLRWKSELAPMFDLEMTSLTEREAVTKRKVFLKLSEDNPNP